MKKRNSSVKKDNRIAIEVRFGEDKAVFARGALPTYAKAMADAISNFGITDPCHIERVRAVDDRIFIEIALGVDAPWFTEKSCPPLKLSDDKLYAESVGTGGWGVTPPPAPMQTRAQTKVTKAVRVVNILLHNLGTDEVEKFGRAASYDEAIARRSGKVRKGWNVAVSDANDERILVVCKKGAIFAGDGVVTAVTAPKPKAKKSPVLTEKLVGKNPEAAFAPTAPVQDVPGILNAAVEPHQFKRCIPRPLDPAVGFWRIKVEILGGPIQHLQVRRDVFMRELLAQAFNGIDLSENERVKIVLKPLKMEDGTVLKIERICLNSRIALTVQIWDGSSRRCGIEVSPTATVAEIVRKAQYMIDDEPLEKCQYYTIYHRNQPAAQPWIQKECELRPNVDVSGTVIVRNRNGDMIVGPVATIGL
jgi:hypothetical protein